jgi:hypothetical protein
MSQSVSAGQSLMADRSPPDHVAPSGGHPRLEVGFAGRIRMTYASLTSPADGIDTS